jgi:adenylate cyclase
LLNLQSLQRWGVPSLSLLVALISWATFSVSQPAWLSAAQELSTDWAWRLLAKTQDERRVILVDIDERSLQEIGPWPWPRETQAKLLDKLGEQGVSLLAIDVVFTSGQSGDDVLSKALSQHRPVLAQAFAMPQQGGQTKVGQLAGALDWPSCPAPFSEASGFLANHEGLIKPMKPPLLAGHITPRLSQDGVVRQQPAVLCFQEKAYPALGIAAASEGAQIASWSLQRGKAWTDAPWLLTSSSGAFQAVPLSKDGDIRVPWWSQPSSFVSVPAADLLSGKVPKGLFGNAWALLGSSAFGLNDTIATPFASAAAGMLVHAQVLTGMIDGRVPFTPIGSQSMQAAAALLGFLLLVMLSTLSKRQAKTSATKPTNSSGTISVIAPFPIQLFPLLGLCWAVALWALHLGLLQTQGWVVGWLLPALTVFIASLTWGILEHTKSRIDRERLYTHLSSYLPAPVAAALALQPPSSAIKASTRMVSVMFADIRNFSAYCEARPPQEAAAVLHAFFSTATRVVEDNDGVIEAFQGDAVLAVWYGEEYESGQNPIGASFSKKQSSFNGLSNLSNYGAQRAMKAAAELYAAMQGSLPDPAPAGLEPLALGLGLECGPAMAGSFGLASRRTHMVLGRTVTIASRLVEMTADLAHPILVGEGLAAQIAGDGLQSMGTFLLDGLRVPHHVYAYRLAQTIAKHSTDLSSTVGSVVHIRAGACD